MASSTRTLRHRLGRWRRSTDSRSSRSIDRYLPEDVRAILEERFWHTVEEKSTLEAFSGDRTIASARRTRIRRSSAITGSFTPVTSPPARSSSPTSSTAGSSPRGRSTAGSSSRLSAVLIAYIHDVGMNDPTREGRRVHAIYAAQMPFSGAMDDVLARLWESGGPVVSRIGSVGAVDPFRVPDDVVLRELAALALAHSKSMVPATLHADFSRLRSVLQQGQIRPRRAVLHNPAATHRGDDAAPSQLTDRGTRRLLQRNREARSDGAGHLRRRGGRDRDDRSATRVAMVSVAAADCFLIGSSPFLVAGRFSHTRPLLGDRRFAAVRKLSSFVIRWSLAICLSLRRPPIHVTRVSK